MQNVNAEVGNPQSGSSNTLFFLLE